MVIRKIFLKTNLKNNLIIIEKYLTYLQNNLVLNIQQNLIFYFKNNNNFNCNNNKG